MKTIHLLWLLSPSVYSKFLFSNRKKASKAESVCPLFGPEGRGEKRRNIDQPSSLSLFAACRKVSTLNSAWSPLELEAMRQDTVYLILSWRLLVYGWEMREESNTEYGNTCNRDSTYICDCVRLTSDMAPSPRPGGFVRVEGECDEMNQW